jgi:hypothetical protein
MTTWLPNQVPVPAPAGGGLPEPVELRRVGQVPGSFAARRRQAYEANLEWMPFRLPEQHRIPHQGVATPAPARDRRENQLSRRLARR